MAAAAPLANGLAAYLEAQERKDLLRFLTCGSVDDGKSTLIGRLLYESKALFEDQLAALAADSRKAGTRGDDVDFALLLDGLSAEREQGITIDVAYRFFSTDRRQFIVADTPGHEQYTRNMATGASTADLAVILIDARKGVLVQTRRHSYIVALLGIRHVVVAINKMDLVNYSETTFAAIAAEYREFAATIGLGDVAAIPIAAVHGDNVVSPSAHTPWYHGPTLIQHLEAVEVDQDRLQQQAFRLPVQWVNRPHSEFRGFAGTIASGVIRPGQRIRILPSARESTVDRVVTADGDLDEAVAAQSVTLVLADEIDVSRGDIIASTEALPQVADQFQATLVWMSEAPMHRGRSYLMKIGARTVTATVMPLKYKINVNTLEHVAASSLELNEIGVVDFEIDRPIAFDPYLENRETGGFILIDRITNDTVGAGMLRFALRRSQNLHLQALDLDKAAHASIKGQKPVVLWFTGLSGSGKSAIANVVERKLFAEGRHTYLLDGDNVRHGLTKDLGFTDADRVENIRRVAEVARLMADAGLIVLTAFISPFRNERRMARTLLPEGEFVEVFIDTPLAVAEARDPKGLYRKARRGELTNFTGIDSPYEPPEAAEIRIDTTATSVNAAADLIVEYLRARQKLDA
jgi:bifunctional enzyme CysN/CysC